MKTLKKIGLILLIIFFPIGAIYCLGKSLFANGFAGFLGVLVAAGIGIVAGIYIADPQSVIDFFMQIKEFFTALPVVS